jgi:hypothetical protein
MLGQLLERMREHKKPEVPQENLAAPNPAVFGKGYYVDIYV